MMSKLDTTTTTPETDINFIKYQQLSEKSDNDYEVRSVYTKANSTYIVTSIFHDEESFIELMYRVINNKLRVTYNPD